jgi:hypothetical protein
MWLGIAVPAIRFLCGVGIVRINAAADVAGEEARLLEKYDRAGEAEEKTFCAIEDDFVKLCVDAHKARNRADEARARFSEISVKKGAKPSEIMRAGNLATETMIVAAQLSSRVLEAESEVEQLRFIRDLNQV